MNITRIAATTTQSVSVARSLAAMLWWRLVSLSVTEPSTAGSMPALVLSVRVFLIQQMAPVRGPALRHTYREADGTACHWPPVQNLAGAPVRVAQRFPKVAGSRRFTGPLESCAREPRTRLDRQRRRLRLWPELRSRDPRGGPG